MVAIKNSLGKISFTCDWWTIGDNYHGPGFLAITAHWCTEELILRSALVVIEYMLPDEWWKDTFKRAFKRLTLSPKKVGQLGLISDRKRGETFLRLRGSPVHFGVPCG